MDLLWKVVVAALSAMLATAPASAAVVCPLGSHDAGGLCAFNARPTIVLPTSFSFDVASGFYLDASKSFQADGDPISFSWDMNSDGVADLTGGRVFVPGNYFGAPQVGTTFKITLEVRDLYSNLRSYGLTSAVVVPAVAAVPEPATWAMMLLGFGMIGAISRYRRRAVNVSFG